MQRVGENLPVYRHIVFKCIYKCYIWEGAVYTLYGTGFTALFRINVFIKPKHNKQRIVKV